MVINKNCKWFHSWCRLWFKFCSDNWSPNSNVYTSNGRLANVYITWLKKGIIANVSFGNIYWAMWFTAFTNILFEDIGKYDSIIKSWHIHIKWMIIIRQGSICIFNPCKSLISNFFSQFQIQSPDLYVATCVTFNL